MGAGDVHQIQSWQQATKQQWDRLNDPDRAIGIPMRIGGVAVAPG